MSRTPTETFHALTDAVVDLVNGGSNTTGAQDVAGLYAEQTHVSFPLTPALAPLTSRDEVAAHFTALGVGLSGMVSNLRAENVQVHRSVDPEVVIGEFTYEAKTAQGEVSLPNVFVMRVRDGKIVESRDYSASLG